MSWTSVLLLGVPLLSVLVVQIIEGQNASGRSSAPLCFAFFAINTGLTLWLSLGLLMPLVEWVAPHQWFSLAEWQVPVWCSFTLSILCLDFFQYVWHRLHHHIPFLWRLHRLHHSEQQLQAPSSLLHHPLETLLTYVGVVVFAVILDIPLVALTTYSVLIAAHAAFVHKSRPLPPPWDRVLQWFFITPNFHRRHHYVNEKDGHSHFGMLFIYWDVLFKTTRWQPCNAAEHFGLSDPQRPASASIFSYLVNPFQPR